MMSYETAADVFRCMRCKFTICCLLATGGGGRTRKETVRRGCYLRESETDYMSSNCAVTNCTYLSKFLSRANILSLVVS